MNMQNLFCNTSDTSNTRNNDNDYTEVFNPKIFKRKSTVSFGIICYTIINGEIYYLLAQQRDTIAYKEFIRCSIPERDIINYISNMSISEKEKLLNTDFQELLDDCILKKNTRIYKAALDCRNQFNENVKKYKLLLEDKNIGLCENPWIFPKGRKYDEMEDDKQCAKREFIEETGCNSVIIEDFKPFEEIYQGLDRKSYKNLYYIGYIDYNKCLQDIKNINMVQTNLRKTVSDEITKIKFFMYNQAINKLPKSKQYIIRSINTELLFKLRRKKITRSQSF